MDSVEQAFEQMTRSFRTQIEAAVAAPPEEPAPEPLWQRAAAGIGGGLLYLIGFLAVIGLFGAIAAVARIGWNLAGGVGW